MTENSKHSNAAGIASAVDRRSFLARVSSVAMAGGLALGYGAFAAAAARFLYPAGEGKKVWLYVGDPRRIRVGESLLFRMPSGIRAANARRGATGGVADFGALSSTCPHLGCQVHWEAANNRFFCPCHNGTFDVSGKATGGPPARAGQSLKEFKLKIERGLLFVEAPASAPAVGQSARVAPPRGAGPGHDPCLTGDNGPGELPA